MSWYRSPYTWRAAEILTAQNVTTNIHCDPGLEEFFRLIDEESFPFHIGFDSCMVPGILNFSETVDTDSVDTCEGGRFSCYITADGFLLPCSFDNQDQRWAYDLSKGAIHDGWSSQVFENFRDHLREACHGCEKRTLCMGGCPVRPEIVLCRDKSKKRKISKGLIE